MSGRHSFKALRERLPAERRARVAAKAEALREEMALHELRQARALTQVALGEILNVEQPAIAKMERRTDMYVSNLRRFIEAMGGELRIVAHFPEGDVTITNFSELGETDQAETA
jgi:hypothetical protein